MKLLIEEKDETQTYRPIDIERQNKMLKDYPDRLEIYIPNLCGGETRITIFKLMKDKLFDIEVGSI